MNKYFINDAREISKLSIQGKVDLIITSPPYFDMKDYGSKNQIGFGQTFKQYLHDMEEVFRQCYKVSKENSSFWVIVDVLKKNGEMILLPFEMIKIAEKAGWNSQDIIIWEKDKTIPFTHKGQMRNIFEYILFFTKGGHFKYYRERITSINNLAEWWIRYPERYSPHGKSPSNIWKYPLPLQGSWGKKYIRHFCPLPQKLIERIILLSSDPGDCVFDPFAGTGAVLAAAYRLNRKYIGSDLNEEYKKMFSNYIEDIQPLSLNYSEKTESDKFYQTILELRILKFVKVLCQKIIKVNRNTKINKIIAIPNNNVTLKKNHVVSCNYIIEIDAPQKNIKEEIEDIIHKRPLSKFGIAADIKVIDSFQFMALTDTFEGKDFFAYDNGVTYKPGKKIKNIREVKSKEKFPTIISSINITNKKLNVV